MSMKKVSVIIPVYNVEKYLKDCLYTLIHQSYSNLEIICVDDGSLDQSGKICDEFASMDQRIQVYHQKNSGPSIARNFALKICTGDYITFMDSDDQIEYTYIEELVEALEKNEADISICGHICIYPRFKRFVHAYKDQVLSQKEALGLILSDSIIKNYAWGKCYKKEVWQNITFPEHCFYEDVLTIYKTFMKAKKCALIKKPLYRYLIRSNSITNQLPKTRALELKEAYRKQAMDILSIYPDLKYKALRSKFIGEWMVLISHFK